jgi:thiamine pyrophosphokinase
MMGFDTLFESKKPIALVGGGPCLIDDLALAGQFTDCFIAADGGADALLAGGHQPQAVIGDLDSIGDTARRQIPNSAQFLIAEQDSTDFEKCLRHISAPLILGVGFTGGRIDHQMAAFHALLRYRHVRCILLGPEDVLFLAPPELALDLPLATRLSLFPMGPVAGHSEGLAWPIDGLNLAPDYKIATSNHTVGPVRLKFSGAQMLVILPRDCLQPALFALLALSAPADLWPAADV